MKIIHTADIHLGSAFSGKFGNNPEKADLRKRELLTEFSRLLQYAKENSVSALLISGDLFDTSSSGFEKNFVFSEARKYPEIQIYFVKGNHDPVLLPGELPDNFHTFGYTWDTYELSEDITVSGITAKDNEFIPYAELNLPSEKVNLVMMHGIVAETKEKGESVYLRNLAGKNIDYLALGHIHKNSMGDLDTRGKYAYPGALTGRGLDETGEKGFYLLDVEPESHNVRFEFVPFAKRRVEEVFVDVTGKNSYDEIYQTVNEILLRNGYNSDTILRVVLIGEISGDFEWDTELLRLSLESSYFYFEVKNKTTEKTDFSELSEDRSIMGSLYRELEKSDLDPAGKTAILKMARRLFSEGENRK